MANFKFKNAMKFVVIVIVASGGFRNAKGNIL